MRVQYINNISEDSFVELCMDALCEEYFNTIFSINKRNNKYAFSCNTLPRYMVSLIQLIKQLYNYLAQSNNTHLVISLAKSDSGQYYLFNSQVYTNFYRNSKKHGLGIFIQMLIFIANNIIVHFEFTVHVEHICCIIHDNTNSSKGCAIIIDKILRPKIIHNNDILKIFGEMYSSGDMVDCTLVCIGGEHIRGHSVMLAIVSDVLKTCIKYTKEIYVDFDVDIVQFAIDYIYLNIVPDVEYTDDFLTTLYSFAHMYNITNLLGVATNLIVANIHSRKYIENMANLYNDDYLRTCLEFM